MRRALFPLALFALPDASSMASAREDAPKVGTSPAQAGGKETATTIRATIGIDGKALNCTIVESSGSAELDESACTTMMRRAHFRPALDKQGHPMESTYTSRIRWRIQR